MGARKGFTSLPRQERLSVQAAEQIAGMILTQTLQPGQRLPPERELSASLGVSRTVVREAIRLLEARRLVEASAGGGVIVRGRSHAPVSDSISMLVDSTIDHVSFVDVQQVRGVLETAAAKMAAERAGQADLDAIGVALDEMLGAGTLRQHMDADRSFHVAIASATHNKVYVLLLHAIADVLMGQWEAYWAALGAGPADTPPDDPAHVESDRHHATLYDAICRRDLAAIDQVMAMLFQHWSAMHEGP